MTELSLDVINEAFGPASDLYLDVLAVKSNSTPSHIQRKYTERRDDLLCLLADIEDDQEDDSITASHRYHAQCQLEAVVMAGRILNDPELRLEYDDLRAQRIAQRVSTSPERRRPVKPGHSTVPLNRPVSSGRPRSSRRNRPLVTPTQESHPTIKRYPSDKPIVGDDIVDDEPPILRLDKQRSRQISLSPPAPIYSTKTRPSRGRRRHRSPDDRDATVETFFSDDNTVVTVDTKIAEDEETEGEAKESTGAWYEVLEDTKRTFEQVFHVFTLTDQDIRAVTSRIDRAMRQMERVRSNYDVGKSC